MESPGKFLKKEREIRNISLKEISKFTKVNQYYLKAIEEDRYDILPGAFYVKAYLSVYARYLTLNSKDIVLEYENYLKRLTLPETLQMQRTLPKGKSARSRFFLSLISIINFSP